MSKRTAHTVHEIFRIVCEITLLAMDYALRRIDDGHCINVQSGVKKY